MFWSSDRRIVNWLIVCILELDWLRILDDVCHIVGLFYFNEDLEFVLGRMLKSSDLLDP